MLELEFQPSRGYVHAISNQTAHVKGCMSQNLKKEQGLKVQKINNAGRGEAKRKNRDCAKDQRLESDTRKYIYMQ